MNATEAFCASSHRLSWFTQCSAEDLRDMGHAITGPDKPTGGAQATLIDRRSGELTGGFDPRKDGCALGY